MKEKILYSDCTKYERRPSTLATGYSVTYVGVAVAHPWHGVSYSECADPVAPHDESKVWCDNSPEAQIDVHGGLTFAGKCADLSKERWEAVKGSAAGKHAEAKKYPFGDAARWVAEWSPLLDSYEQWRERMMARSICHLPALGEPDDVWWFGFDCADCDDLVPGIQRLTSDRLGTHYWTIGEVREQVASLAKQLAQIQAQAQRTDSENDS